MKRVMIDPSFFKRNRKNLVGSLKNNSLAIVPSNDELTRNGDQNFPYRQGSDIFYLNGIEQEQSILTLCPNHPDPKLREILFLSKPDEIYETWAGHKLNKEEAKALSGIENIKWLDDFDLTIRDLALNSGTIYLNVNEYVKYHTDLIYNDYRLAEKLKKQFPAHQFERLAPLVTSLRLIKQPDEIELMQKSCDITGSAFRRILKFVKPGVTEYEIEAEMIHEFIRNGARGHAYQPIIGSGKNSLVLHYNENSDICNDGDLLLLDFGAEYGNYAADCSRTIPVNGKFTQRQRACYEAVLRVQKEATKLFVPGNSPDRVNRETWKMMEDEMIKLGLFTSSEVKNQNPDQPMYFKYLMHGVAHFVGLDVHDVGSKYRKFEKGMVLTIEPGIYIKEENIGIRIENNIVVDDNPFDLMAGIPREVDEIEELMQG